MSSGLCCISPSMKIIMSALSRIAFRVPVSRLLPLPRLILCLRYVTFWYSFLIISAVLSFEPSSTRMSDDRCFSGKDSRNFLIYFSSLRIGVTIR